MRELQLVGYTADLKNLVFCDTDESAVRFKTPVGEDLVGTLREVLELLQPDHPLLAHLAPPAPPAPPPTPTPSEPPTGPLAGLAVAEHTAGGATSDNGSEPTPARSRDSRLSPREIQALLRAGQAPRTVARHAGTDEAWVRRWLAPIEAEVRTVLEAVQRARMSKARLGPSRDLLGDAVRKNLAGKGLRADDESVEWSASRRESDEVWKVTLRYRNRGRLQRAIWRYDPETGTVDPRNALAVDVAWTRPSRAKNPSTGKKKTERSKKSGAENERVPAKKQSTGKRVAKSAEKSAVARAGKKAAKKAAPTPASASKSVPEKKASARSR